MNSEKQIVNNNKNYLSNIVAIISVIIATIALILNYCSDNQQSEFKKNQDSINRSTNNIIGSINKSIDSLCDLQSKHIDVINKNAKVSQKPILKIYDKGGMNFGVKNNGMGPALIKKVQLIINNKSYINNELNNLRINHEDFSFWYEVYQRKSLYPNEKMEYFTFSGEEINSLIIKIYYTSTYEDEEFNEILKIK